MAKKNKALRRKSRVPAAVRRQRLIMDRIYSPPRDNPKQPPPPKKPPPGG